MSVLEKIKCQRIDKFFIEILKGRFKNILNTVLKKIVKL